MAPRLLNATSETQLNQENVGLPSYWILVIIANVILAIFLITFLIYCLKRRKKKRELKALVRGNGSKLSPIFRKRVLSKNFVTSNFITNTLNNLSEQTSSLSSKGSLLKFKRNNRVSNSEINPKLKERIQHITSLTPVRYNSPSPFQVLSSVYTIQTNTNAKPNQRLESVNLDPVNLDPVNLDPVNLNSGNLDSGNLDNSNLVLSKLGKNEERPSISFKILTNIQTRLNTEMNDSRVKLKTLDYKNADNINNFISNLEEEKNRIVKLADDLTNKLPTDLVNNLVDNTISNKTYNLDDHLTDNQINTQTKNQLKDLLENELNNHKNNNLEKNEYIFSEEKTIKDDLMSLNSSLSASDTSNENSLNSLPTSLITSNHKKEKENCLSKDQLIEELNRNIIQQQNIIYMKEVNSNVKKNQLDSTDSSMENSDNYLDKKDSPKNTVLTSNDLFTNHETTTSQSKSNQPNAKNNSKNKTLANIKDEKNFNLAKRSIEQHNNLSQLEFNLNTNDLKCKSATKSAAVLAASTVAVIASNPVVKQNQEKNLALNTSEIKSENKDSSASPSKDRKQSRTEVDRQLYEIHNKIIQRKSSSTSSRKGSSKQRMRSAYVQTTPSLKRANLMRSINKENAALNANTSSTSNFDSIANSNNKEATSNLIESDFSLMKPIEEENFFYDPALETFERKYFIYLISDTNNLNYKKDCIGKILLPVRGQLTLADLREQLFKESEESVQKILKKSKNFRFLTETYRFVAQNETIASVKETYPTQGIFLKLNSSDNQVNYLAGKAKKGNDLTTILNAAFSENLNTSKANANINLPTVANISSSKGNNLNPIQAYCKQLQVPTNTNLNAKNATPSNPTKNEISLNQTNQVLNTHSPLPSNLLSSNNSTLLKMENKNTCIYLNRTLSCLNNRCLNSRKQTNQIYPSHILKPGESIKICFARNCKNRSELKCAKCGRVYYCSAECKKNHWPDHKLICKRPPWRL